MKKSMIMIPTFLLVSFSAQAREYPQLTRFIHSETEALVAALKESELSDPMDTQGKYQFKRFFLRLQAKVGFSAPGINVDLVPELELVFQKDKVPSTPHL